MQSQLLHNYWFGKAVGATCAWIWAPTDPVWLALSVITGIALGHLYDAWALQHRDDDQLTLSRLAQAHAREHSPHVEFLFAGLGRLAKSDGRVSADQITYTERLMRQMNLTGADARQAQNWFNEGKKVSYPLQSLSRACLAAGEPAASARLSVLRCLCGLVANAPTDANLACLKQLGGYLGFAPPRIARILGDFRQGSAKQGGSTAHGNDDGLTAAYECLGIPAGSTASTAKSAYRQLISKHHPDKLGPDASDSAKQQAQARMVALREALERIEAHG